MTSTLQGWGKQDLKNVQAVLFMVEIVAIKPQCLNKKMPSCLVGDIDWSGVGSVGQIQPHSGFRLCPLGTEGQEEMGVALTCTACTWRQKPCHSAAEGNYMVSARCAGGCEASASPHWRRAAPRFHIGTSLDSLPPGPEAWELVSSPLPPPALHLESRGGRW